MKRSKKIILWRGMPAILSAALLLTTMPVTVAATGSDNSIMEDVLAEAIQEGSERTQAAQQSGITTRMWDTSYFNPDPVQAEEARSQAMTYPEKFDLRDLGYVTPVKLQDPFETCWGFSAIAAAETSILSKKGVTYSEYPLDLSELHLAWFSAHALPQDSDTGQGGEGTYSGANTMNGLNNGGFAYYGTMTFASGVGPRSEAEIPYQPKDPEKYELRYPDGSGNYSTEGDWSLDESQRFGYGFGLEESSLLPCPVDETQNEDGEIVYAYNEDGTNAIKNELTKGRAVSILFCADQYLPGQDPEDRYLNEETWAHYTYQIEPINHAVTIVGWDDSYDVSNFKKNHQPEGPGAWIVKNSWGAQSNGFPHKTDWGDDGYFYLSYYDRSLYNPETFEFFTDETQYDSMYVNQYDYMTASGIDVHETDKQISEANIFQADDMTLRYVSTTTSTAGAKTTYEIYRLREGYTSPTDGELVERIEATYPYAGYHRANLTTEPHFHSGEFFSVVVTQEADGKYLYGAASALSKDWWESQPADMREDMSYSVGVIHKGESFLGGIAEDGTYDWMDWKDFSRGYIAATDKILTLDNLPIKAYSDPYEFPPKTELSSASVTLSTKTYTYNGRAKTPGVTVTAGGQTLEKGKDYTVSYKNNKNAGKATVTVAATASSDFTGSKAVNYTIKKASQTLKLNVSKKNYKAAVLAKKKATFTVKASKNKNALTYKVTKGSAKYISVSKKGVVTLKKGAKKGTYKVSVTAKASANYKSAKKTVTITVK